MSLKPFKILWVPGIMISFAVFQAGCQEADSNVETRVMVNAPAVADAKTELAPFLKDRDKLLQAFASVHDTATGIEYSEQQLELYSQNTVNNNYKTVLERFVAEELKKEIDTFQTVSQSVNPREIIVTTKDQHIYMVSMQKDYRYNGIWKVVTYSDFYINGNADENLSYKELKLEQLPEPVKRWAEERLANSGWMTDQYRLDDKMYMIIKSASDPMDSVELEGVSLRAGEVTVRYQKFSYSSAENASLINDYVLFELDAGNINHVDFQLTLEKTEK